MPTKCADASFELLARRILGKVPNYFDVEQFDVNVEQRYNAIGKRVTVAIAVVKVEVGGETLLGGRGQRPGQRARRRAAQGPRQIPEISSRGWSSSITACVSSMAARKR